MDLLLGTGRHQAYKGVYMSRREIRQGHYVVSALRRRDLEGSKQDRRLEWENYNRPGPGPGVIS